MDFSWFLTIPGMLITGGVLLLIIALIIFITTSNKKQKTEKETNSEQAPAPAVTNGTPQGNINQEIPINNVATQTPALGQTINQDNASVELNGSNTGISVPVGSEIQQEVPTVATTPYTEASSMDLDQQIASTPVDVAQPSLTDMSNSMFTTPNPEVPTVNTDSMMINSQPSVEVNNSATINPMDVNLNTESYNVTPQETTNPMDLPTVDPIVSAPPVDSVASAPSVDVNINPVVTNPTEVNMPVNPVNDISTSINQPNFDTPVVDFNQTVAPMNQASEVNTIVNNPENSLPVSDTPVVSSPEQPVSIYGGASPIVQDININNNQNHQIYGGADPLEHTQIIPTPTPEIAPVVEMPTIITSQNPVVDSQSVTPAPVVTTPDVANPQVVMPDNTINNM